MHDIFDSAHAHCGRCNAAILAAAFSWLDKYWLKTLAANCANKKING